MGVARLSPEQGTSPRLNGCWDAVSTACVLSSTRALLPQGLEGSGTREPVLIPSLIFNSGVTLSNRRTFCASVSVTIK